MPAAIERAIRNANVPSPSPVLVRLMALAESDACTLEELADVIRRDPGLTARIFSVACSPTFGGRSLPSIEHCLSALGTRLVRSLATCLAVQRLFEGQAALAGVDLGRFWRHALAVAELAQDLAQRAGDPAPLEAYFAGLLHDVGQLILLVGLGDDYRALRAGLADGGPLAEREQAALGVSHDEVAVWLVDRWGFDGLLGDRILGLHASPQDILGAPSAGQVLWLAHALLENGDTLLAQPPATEIVSGLGLSTDAVLEAGAAAAARTLQFAEALGLPLDDGEVGGDWLTLPTAVPPPDAPDALTRSLGLKALLQSLQAGLGGIEDEAALWRAVRESAVILFDLGDFALLRCLPDGQGLSGEGFALQAPVLRQRLRPDPAHSALGRVVQAPEAQLLLPASLSLNDRQWARALKSEGLLVLPMQAHGELRGLLLFGVQAADGPRLESLMPLLEAFAGIVGLAFEQLAETLAEAARARVAADARFQTKGRRIVHEVGNPLGIIKTYLVLLGQKLPAESEAHEELLVLREEIDRVGQIVERLSEVPPESAELPGSDLGEVVRELLLLYRKPLFIERHIALVVNVPETPVRVACPRNSLAQILLNLLKNASEALNSGQIVRLSALPAVIHQGEAMVQLNIEDDGPGLPPAAVQALTGQLPGSLGQRRGHGLAVVADLARRHDLRITLNGEVGRGARITLLLPVVPPSQVALEEGA